MATLKELVYLKTGVGSDDMQFLGDEEPGMLESIWDAVERSKENSHTCDRVENKTNKKMVVCVQDKKESRDRGTWIGGTRVIEKGSTLQIDSNKEDIEGIVHKDGSVTKIKGKLGQYFGWTEEHDAAWIQQNWPGCGGVEGFHLAPSKLNFLSGTVAVNSGIYTYARVDSSQSGWHEGKGLAANTDYRVIPRSSDRWTINRGTSFDDFHGMSNHGRMSGSEIGIPKDSIPIGGIVVLVWHHQTDGTSVAQIFDFPNDTNAIQFKVGENGGSIHFIVADRAGTYGDNFGDCIVAIAKL